MGREATCSMTADGITSVGRAFLESTAIIFRPVGGARGSSTTIPLSAVQRASAKDGVLTVRAEKVYRFELGNDADGWLKRLQNPPTRLSKLGVKSGDSVLAVACPKAFVGELKAAGATVRTKFAERAQYDLIVIVARKLSETTKAATLVRTLTVAGALWIVYPKGNASIPEREVRGVFRRLGLVDNKSCAFDEELTAIRYVVPKVRRAV